MTATPAGADYGHAAALAAIVGKTITTMAPADYLAALGNTADEVAETLRRLGVTGQRVVADSCPVANYLREFAGVGHPAMSPAWIKLGDGWIATPAPVARFVARFDLGEFPDLITPVEASPAGE